MQRGRIFCGIVLLMNISDLQKETLHHAYVINGDVADFVFLQGEIAKLFDMQLYGNPDVYIRRFDTFTVSNAREVVDFANKSAIVSGAFKIILIYFSAITVESQNILLKTLEEPSAGTYIFILTPNTDMLLSTVLSRCMKISINHKKGDHVAFGTLSKDAETFINASVPERLKIIEKINKGKDKAKNKTKFLEILSGVEVHLNEIKQKNVQGGTLDTWGQRVRAVLQAKEYIHEKGAMSKILMESVALVI